MRFTIRNNSRYARMLEALEPWPLLDALRWGVGMRQVSSGDMVTAIACRRTEDTLRLNEYDRARMEHSPCVEVTVQGPVSRVIFSWKEEDGHGE